MLTLPPPTIAVETLRDWLIAGRGASDPGEQCEARFAATLAAGVPSAWALFQDVVRPRFVASLVPYFRDPREAVALADSVTGQIYVTRENASPNGIRNLPARATIFQLCRALAYLRLVAARRTEVEPPAACAELDALDIAQSLGNGAIDQDPRYSEIKALDALAPPELRSLDLARQLELQRPHERDPAGTVKILNLPAVLTLLFFGLITIATFYILDQPATDRTNRTIRRLADSIDAGRFDEAVRLLSDDPPPGLEHLEPVRPEVRNQRIRELRARPLDPLALEILAPFGRIDETKPQVVWRGIDLHGELKLRIIQVATGNTVVDRTIQADEYHVDIGAELPRGSTYIVAIEHRRTGAQGQFEILSEDARNYVERRIADVSALAGDASPQTIAFLRAHVYRAEDCIAASLGEWRRLRSLVPDNSYPREEAAWTFDAELKLPRRALGELSSSD